MRAVVVHGAGDVRVEDRPDPVAGAGEVLVAMEWGGICGSDLSYARHGSSGTAVLKHPLVLGHEVAGRVVATGPGVEPVGAAAPGTPVTFQPAVPLPGATLPARLAGRTNLLPVRYFGSAGQDPHTDGGFSELRAVRVEQLRALPEGVGTRAGAVAEPLAVALHAVGRARAVAGELTGRTVLVNGCGPIGCLVVAAARLAGAGEVVAADVSAASLEVAAKLGADRVVDLSAGQALPEDVEVVLEASGAPAALGGVLHAAARGGTVVQVGNLPGSAVPAVLGDLVTRELVWAGSFRFAEEVDDAVAALAGGLDVEPMLTHTFDLDQAPEALRVAGDRASGSSKVMLRLG
ncbi:L-idonate 5-dehydrogenase [Cellulomonas endophytica]|uniref:L-idonate 5-dehydrogenase n=1 Tax=Cellulomonas endophytica TaxID=2494735 RepID=UPI001010563D|nr:L-idonate 5-dehydrogenase [Cellulomonas endophytica]